MSVHLFDMPDFDRTTPVGSAGPLELGSRPRSTKLKLRSDFRERYDVWFDRGDAATPTFERLTTAGPDRREIFRTLKAASLLVPNHGRVRDLADAERLVVYLDEQAHRGEGKHLMWGQDAESYFPEAFASVYVGDYPFGVAKSIRHLHIGTRTFRLVYESKNDWRSNCGDCDVVSCVEETPPVYRAKLDYPLVAVDFVEAFHRLYAVDMNIAPGIGGTAVEELMTGEQIVGEIKGWLTTRTR